MGGHGRSSSSNAPRFPYVEAHVLPGEADDAGALFFDLGALGVEVRDDTTLRKASAGRTTIIASFDQEERAQEAVAQLPAAWAAQLGEVVGDEWRDEWKKHFEPFEVCPSIVVRPPWRTYVPRSGERVIVLEPGRAFGTGLHETTRLVAEALAKRAARVCGATVLDVGCGSGILGLVALELGAKSVRAADVDPEAVAATRENAERNGVLHALYAESVPLDGIEGIFDVVLANIEAGTLQAIAPALIERLSTHGGWVVLSGILAPRAAPTQWREVRAAYAGLELEEQVEKGEWLAAVLRA